MPQIKKETVLKALIGYERGAAFAKKERLKKLSRLSPQESLAIFINLWKTWEMIGKKTDSKKLNQLKLKHLTERRKKIDKLAKWKKARERSS